MGKAYFYQIKKIKRIFFFSVTYNKVKNLSCSKYIPCYHTVTVCTDEIYAANLLGFKTLQYRHTFTTYNLLCSQRATKITSVFLITLPDDPSNKPGHSTISMRPELCSLGANSLDTW